ATNGPGNPAVYLWFDLCRPNIHTPVDAALLLLHESMRHLGLENEEQCDVMAMAVHDAWQRSQRPAATGWVIADSTNAPAPRGGRPSTSLVDGKMLVWGGTSPLSATVIRNTGAIFDPLCDCWAPLNNSS